MGFPTDKLILVSRGVLTSGISCYSFALGPQIQKRYHQEGLLASHLTWDPRGKRPHHNDFQLLTGLGSLERSQQIIFPAAHLTWVPREVPTSEISCFPHDLAVLEVSPQMGFTTVQLSWGLDKSTQARFPVAHFIWVPTVVISSGIFCYPPDLGPQRGATSW